MAETTTSVRVDSATVRLVKIAAAVSGESMSQWMTGACRARLEREGKAGLSKRRVATVQFVEPKSASK